jgi:Fur family zinc uptake transcriptional regulator
MVGAMTDKKTDSRLDAFEAICRRQGGRLTRQRRAVLAVLLASKRPVSAYELRDMILPEDPAVTPASVYRCLGFLLTHGFAHRLETTRAFIVCDHLMPAQDDHSGAPLTAHPHAAQFLICRRCGTVAETQDHKLADAVENLGARLGFTLDQRTVELTGTCAPCAAGGRPQI